MKQFDGIDEVLTNCYDNEKADFVVLRHDHNTDHNKRELASFMERLKQSGVKYAVIQANSNWQGEQVAECLSHYCNSRTILNLNCHGVYYEKDGKPLEPRKLLMYQGDKVLDYDNALNSFFKKKDGSYVKVKAISLYSCYANFLFFNNDQKRSLQHLSKKTSSPVIIHSSEHATMDHDTNLQMLHEAKMIANAKISNQPIKTNSFVDSAKSLSSEEICIIDSSKILSQTSKQIKRREPFESVTFKDPGFLSYYRTLTDFEKKQPHIYAVFNDILLIRNGDAESIKKVYSYFTKGSKEYIGDKLTADDVRYADNLSLLDYALLLNPPHDTRLSEKILESMPEDRDVTFALYIAISKGNEEMATKLLKRYTKQYNKEEFIERLKAQISNGVNVFKVSEIYPNIKKFEQKFTDPGIVEFINAIEAKDVLSLDENSDFSLNPDEFIEAYNRVTNIDLKVVELKIDESAVRQMLARQRIHDVASEISSDQELNIGKAIELVLTDYVSGLDLTEDNKGKFCSALKSNLKQIKRDNGKNATIGIEQLQDAVIAAAASIGLQCTRNVSSSKAELS